MNWSRLGHPGIFCAALFCNAFTCPATEAADQSTAVPQQATSEVAKPLDKLDEIVVNGKRVTIADLRRTAEKAEDAFYERYNEVNKDDAFDVDCQVDREGLFRQHRCTALYVERAQASDGIMLWEAAKNGCGDLIDLAPNGGCGYIPMTGVIREGRKKEFAESLLKAIKSDARFRELVASREQLDLQVQQARAKLLGRAVVGSP